MGLWLRCLSGFKRSYTYKVTDTCIAYYIIFLFCFLPFFLAFWAELQQLQESHHLPQLPFMRTDLLNILDCICWYINIY